MLMSIRHIVIAPNERKDKTVETLTKLRLLCEECQKRPSQCKCKCFGTKVVSDQVGRKPEEKELQLRTLLGLAKEITVMQ